MNRSDLLWILLGAALLALLISGTAHHGATLDGERARNMSGGQNYPFTDRDPGCGCTAAGCVR